MESEKSEVERSEVAAASEISAGLGTLLPCPFCGSGVEKPVEHFQGYEWNFIHRCNVMGPIVVKAATLEGIAKRWNTRA